MCQGLTINSRPLGSNLLGSLGLVNYLTHLDDNVHESASSSLLPCLISVVRNVMRILMPRLGSHKNCDHYCHTDCTLLMLDPAGKVI